MIVILLPIFYAGVAVFWFCVIAGAVTIYVFSIVLVWVLTALAMGTRAVFRSQWPRNPPRPRFHARPASQARYSDRR